MPESIAGGISQVARFSDTLNILVAISWKVSIYYNCYVTGCTSTYPPASDRER